MRDAYSERENRATAFAAVAALIVGLVAGAPVALGQDASSGTAGGAGTSSEASPQPSGSTPAETEKNPGPQEVDATQSTEGEGGEASSEETSEEGAGEETSASRERLDEIRRRYRLGDGAFEDVESTGEAHRALTSAAQQLSTRAESLAAEARRIEAASDSIAEQLQNPAMPASAKPPLKHEVARGVARRQVWRAQASAAEALRREIGAAAGEVAGFRKHLQQVAEQRAKQDVEERKRVEQAEAAEQSALAEIERMRRQERQERDKEIKALISQRSDVLSKIAEIAREQSEAIKQMGARRSDASEEFTRRQEEIDAEISEFPAEPTDSERREEIDPLFRQIRQHRQQARRDYSAALQELRVAVDEQSAAERRYGAARRELEEVRQRVERLADRDLVSHKVALEEAEVKYRKRQLEKATDVVAAREKSVALHADRIEYYTKVLEEVLPTISETARERYFSVWENENWRNVGASFEEATRYISRVASLRLQQLRSLPNRLYSAEFWGWIFGLLWRLLTIPLGVYLLRDHSRWVIHRLMDFLLRRRFFRRRATGTIKFGEVVRSIVWPLILFLTIKLCVDYVAATFPEAEVLAWGIDVVFLYLIAMALVKVLVLPRAHREKQGSATPSPDLGRLSDRSSLSGEDVVDVFHFDVEQGGKLVRTCRHILVFVLAAWVVPQLFAKVFGHTVLWALVQSFFKWSVIGIVYYELSNWRDEIAALFGRLAAGRIPRVAEFVDEHKGKLYGVLIIALASVYVVIVELGRFARRYFVDTELARRITNFIFRKKIELKQKERDEQVEVDQETDGRMPEEYLELFEERPLVDEQYAVERTEMLDEIEETWEAWTGHGRQGSMAVTGEKGIGKTTLLNQLYRRFRREHPDQQIAYAALVDKIVTSEALVSYLADLFGLGEVPQSRDELVERILELPPRVVMVDDCHHLFFRKIEGFQALQVFLDVVNLTDHHHFWVLTFNRYGWKYLQRVQESKHFFGRAIAMPEWSPSQLQSLVEQRNEMVDYEISFTEASRTEFEPAQIEADDFMAPPGRNPRQQTITTNRPITEGEPDSAPTPPERPDTSPQPSADPDPDEVSVLGRSLDEILPNADEQELRTLIREGPADISRAARQEAGRRGLEVD